MAWTPSPVTEQRMAYLSTTILRRLAPLGAALGAMLMMTACADGGSATSLGTTSGAPPPTSDDGPDPDDGVDDDGVDDDGVDDTTTDDDGGSGACIMNNCSEDAHCDGCPDGATICDTDQGRCVQCDPENQIGCEDGEECTEFGNCVPEGLECPTADGLPTIDCGSDDDCAACAPQFQVCNDGVCTACSDDNVGICQTVETCSEGACVASCPESCTGDSECATCGTDGHEAHACHNHECAQCSSTFPCPDGEQCTDEGVCIRICGIPGQITGTCEEDADCANCPGDSTNCVAPINGGHGQCSPQASGCSDLGEGVVVLPAPYDQVTNACSDDPDCDDVGIQYNVGALLRDITGIDAIDDANIEYPMSKCAEITVGTGGGSLSCGICVPCEVDDDCMDINVGDVAGDAFGPLGAIATAILLDQLFGASEPIIHMFCSPVGAGYGACLPCPTLLNDCSAPPGGGSGNCDHDVCTAGDPLDPTCGSCAAAVCAADDFCCNNMWDAACVASVEEHCAAGCDGGGGGCSHGQCDEGEALDASCGPCISAICTADPFCCQTIWDDICVNLVQTECDGDCGSGCAHSPCQQGGPLPDDCSACVTDVCNEDDFCCLTDWDALCVSEAVTLCAECTGEGCAHDECQEGGPLDADCSACATAICDADDYCCTTNWDSFCVADAGDEPACSC